MRVAARHGVVVTFVSNGGLRPSRDPLVRHVVVQKSADAADDWIAEHSDDGDIVISADIPLASRCLAKGAAVLGPTGRPFTEDNIGDALASRELMSQLRDLGMNTGGPAPLQKAERSRFLQQLDQLIQRIRREKQ